ncbi:hypothetical protein ACGWZF_004260 [Enterobacter hormaechei]
MRTINIELFKFAELDDAAKKAALENVRAVYLDSSDFDFSEYHASLTAFADDIGIAVRDYSFGLNACNVDLDFDDLGAEYKSGARLYAWIVNNVKGLQPGPRVYHVERETVRHGFKQKERTVKRVSGVYQGDDCCNYTGVFCDESLLAPFREFMKAPTDETNLGDLVRAAVDSFCADMLAELESRETDEYAQEWIDANGDDLEFTATGTIYE